jgi:hypothetical protein
MKRESPLEESPRRRGMAPPVRYLLPSVADLATLSDDSVKAMVALADSEGRRSNGYAIVGMLCGTVSFLG